VNDLARTLADPARQLTLLTAVILLGVITPAVLYLEVQHQLFLAFAMMLTATFYARPRVSVVVLTMLQTSFGMLWWVPGNIGGLRLLEAFGGAAFVLIAMQLALVLRRAERGPLPTLVALYTVLLAIAGLRASSGFVGFGEFTRYAGAGLLLVVMATMYTTAHSQRLAALALALTGVPPLIVSAIAFVGGQPQREIDSHGLERLRGGFQHVSSQGQTMAVMAALAFVLADALKGRWRLLAYAYGIGCTATVFLSHSRTSQVGLATFMLAYLTLRRRFVLLAAIFAVGIGTLGSSALFQERFSDIPAFFEADPLEGQEAVDDLGSGRIGIWRNSLTSFTDMKADELLLGVGMGDHRSLYDETMERGRASHNDYLTLLFQLGPLGPLLYLVMLAYGAQIAWRLRSVATRPWEQLIADFTLAMSGTVLTMNFFSNSFVSRINTAWIYWGAVGLTLAVYARLQREGVAPRTGELGRTESARAHPEQRALSTGRARLLDVPPRAPV
jgi:hypothetical protein